MLVLLIILVIYLGTMIGSASRSGRLLPHLMRWYFFVAVAVSSGAVVLLQLASDRFRLD